MTYPVIGFSEENNEICSLLYVSFITTYCHDSGIKLNYVWLHIFF